MERTARSASDSLPREALVEMRGKLKVAAEALDRDTCLPYVQADRRCEVCNHSDQRHVMGRTDLL